jgi:hypothetical protein
MAGVMVAGSRRRDAIALISALVLVAVSVWIVQKIRTSTDPVNSATVYAAYLGVATLMVSLLAFLIPWWWKGHRATATAATEVEVTAAADQFAQRMLDSWRQEAKNRRVSTPAPVRVRWRWGPAEVTTLRTEVITAPVTGTGPRPLPEPSPDEPNFDPPGVLLEVGVVTRLHEEVYCKLPHGRLVLLGGPGAGKTGAMILLLLAALEHRRSMPEAKRVEIPVPAWLTLSGWDPSTQTLHQWVATTMYRDHPYLRAPDYGPDAAGELLRTGRVALFLDGFDEMAPSAQGKALARVDQEGAGLRIVLSSRPEEYRHALGEDRMHNTAVIELQPVGPEVARAYLLRDQIGSQHDRWVQLGDYLTHHPDSIAAQALNNPLTLSLARATYQDEDPTVLTDSAEFRTVAALREHLIDRTLIAAYPNECQRAHATRWLAWIAHHMGSDRNLAWWHIPNWIPQRQPLFTLALAGALAFGLAGALAFGLVGGLIGGLIGGLSGGLPSEDEKEPRAILFRWPRIRELSLSLMSGFVVGFVSGFLMELVVLGGFLFGLLVGLVGGLVSGLIVGFVRLLELSAVPLPRAATATPAARYEIDRRTSIGSGLAFGLFGSFMVGFWGGPAVGLASGLLVALLTVLTGGSVGRVRLTEFILVITGAGRVKFIRVLEDAHHRQVLRQAGAVYQFRHAELQDRLAKTHRTQTQPTPSST